MSNFYKSKEWLDLIEDLKNKKISFNIVENALGFVNPTKAPEGFWISKDGTKRRISKMSSGHIKNCIKLLEKYDPNDSKVIAKINELNNELLKRNPPKEFCIRGAL